MKLIFAAAFIAFTNAIELTKKGECCPCGAPGFGTICYEGKGCGTATGHDDAQINDVFENQQECTEMANKKNDYFNRNDCGQVVHTTKYCGSFTASNNIKGQETLDE